MPLVSIVTPAYNAAQFIAATADSVIAQTYTEWEWIVVDDGSTDDTAHIISSYSDPRIRLIAGSHSGLPAVGRNIGVRNAYGSLIAYLDADDVWVPEKLALQTEYLNAHPEAGLVFSRFRVRYEDLGRMERRISPDLRGLPNPGPLFDRSWRRNVVCASSVVVRRELLDEHGLMDEDPAQRATEDYELWLRLAPHTFFGWIDEPLVIYRVHRSGISADSVALCRGTLLAMEKALRRDPGNPRGGKRFEALCWYRLGRAQLLDGVEGCGRQSLMRSLRTNPWNVRAWLLVAAGFLGPRAIVLLRRLVARLL